MPDNSGEQILDYLPNSESENRSAEIISSNITDTSQPNQETETMEVHHHPDIHHKPKKWKEYFLEFLMIFLAVTMGFIAENIREHQTDKKIGRELIHSLVDDLKEVNTCFYGICKLNYLILLILKGFPANYRTRQIQKRVLSFKTSPIQYLNTTMNFIITSI